MKLHSDQQQKQQNYPFFLRMSKIFFKGTVINFIYMWSIIYIYYTNSSCNLVHYLLQLLLFISQLIIGNINIFLSLLNFLQLDRAKNKYAAPNGIEFIDPAVQSLPANSEPNGSVDIFSVGVLTLWVWTFCFQS